MSAKSSAAISIECSHQPLDLCFHPTKEHLLVAALVDGTVEVHEFAELIHENTANATLHDEDDDEFDSLVSSTRVHTQLLPSKTIQDTNQQASARCVLFSNNGESIVSGGSAGDFVCLDATRLSQFSTAQDARRCTKWTVPNATYHKSALHVLKELPNPNLLATGDDIGGIRIWDVRLLDSSSNSSQSTKPNPNMIQGCVQSWKKQDDYISGLDYSSDGTTLLASSADCTLSVFDIRMGPMNTAPPVNPDRWIRRSDDQEDELLSIKIMKNGRKVVCGTGEGVLCVWSWDTWGDVSDRFPGHPQSIDALLKLDENTLLTGSSDGLIRVVSILPDKFLGVLGDHDGFPVEKLQMNANKNYVGSVTHDNNIRLWDARILKDDYEEAMEEDTTSRPAVFLAEPTTMQGATPVARGSDEEWDDVEDNDEEMKDSDDSGSDDSEDDDEQEPSRNDRRAGRFKSENEKFFEDL